MGGQLGDSILRPCPLRALSWTSAPEPRGRVGHPGRAGRRDRSPGARRPGEAGSGSSRWGSGAPCPGRGWGRVLASGPRRARGGGRVLDGCLGGGQPAEVRAGEFVVAGRFAEILALSVAKLNHPCAGAQRPIGGARAPVGSRLGRAAPGRRPSAASSTREPRLSSARASPVEPSVDSRCGWSWPSI